MPETAPVKATASAKRSSATPKRPGGEDGRRRVLDAAVECILDIGYYKASTNEIARRAGVTWGVLQYHFGSREGLFLAVLAERWQALEVAVATSTVEGATLEERLDAVLEILGTYYDRPAHLAQVQILLDLMNNPDMSAETRKAVTRHGRMLSQAWDPLFASALGEAAKEPDLVRYAFSVLRGYLMGHVLSSSISKVKDDRNIRALLVRGVAATIREEAAARGLRLAEASGGPRPA